MKCVEYEDLKFKVIRFVRMYIYKWIFYWELEVDQMIGVPRFSLNRPRDW